MRTSSAAGRNVHLLAAASVPDLRGMDLDGYVWITTRKLKPGSRGVQPLVAAQRVSRGDAESVRALLAGRERGGGDLRVGIDRVPRPLPPVGGGVEAPAGDGPVCARGSFRLLPRPGAHDSSRLSSARRRAIRAAARASSAAAWASPATLVLSRSAARS